MTNRKKTQQQWELRNFAAEIIIKRYDAQIAQLQEGLEDLTNNVRNLMEALDQ